MENDELFKLIKGFIYENKQTVFGSVFFSIINSFIESILIPRLIANIFNNISDIETLKPNLTKLVLVWILIKLSFICTNHFRKKIEPEITQYITVKLLNAVFKKYEHENELVNTAVLINKIQLIKTNFQDLLYISCTVFVPRIIVLGLSFINFFFINETLGLIITIGIGLQTLFNLNGLSECIETSFNEMETKDFLYDYIEDILNNIDTIQTIPNGFRTEIENIIRITNETKKIQMISVDCINKKQNISYMTNILLFIIIIYTLYRLFITKVLDAKKVTSTVLLLSGMFENIYEMAYYVPEVTNKLGILKNNEKFLKYLLLSQNEVVSNKKFDISSYNINLSNVYFSYDKHKLLENFNLELSENKIICLYGPSGSGKTTFVKLIFGIEKIQKGTIKIGNNDLAKYSISEIRKYISYIPQNTHHLFNMTVYENIIYGYKDSPELRKKITKMFITYNLYDIFKNLDKNKEKFAFLDENVGKSGENLSGGQKQVVHLIRLELNEHSKIIIIDEPTSALDESSRNNVIDYIKYINTKQKTIIIITHDEYYKTISDQILTFSQNENPVLS